MKTAPQILSLAYTVLRNSRKDFPEYERVLSGISFQISSRMTCCAGMANTKTKLIKLSLPFFSDLSNFNNQLRNTVLHEIAHVLSPPKYSTNKRSREIHGRAWKQTCIYIGGMGKTYHSMSLAKEHQSRLNTHESSCSCGCGEIILLGKIRMDRQKSGKVRYFKKGHARRFYKEQKNAKVRTR